MIYRSNLSAPCVAEHFRLKLTEGPFHHDVPSDPILLPECGYWTHDEAAILFNVARAFEGQWLDIGARLGWTAAHCIAADCKVTAVDPALRLDIYQGRFESNLYPLWHGIVSVSHQTSETFFACCEISDCWEGIIIDADHDEPQPRLDAIRAAKHLRYNGVIMLHDFWGKPVRDAARTLMAAGFKCRVYNTPNGVAALTGPETVAKLPVHDADPRVDWDEVRNRFQDFRFSDTI